MRCEQQQSEMKCRIQRSLEQLRHIQTSLDVFSVAASHSLNMNNEPTLAESAENPAFETNIHAARLKPKLDLLQMTEC